MGRRRRPAAWPLATAAAAILGVALLAPPAYALTAVAAAAVAVAVGVVAGQRLSVAQAMEEMRRRLGTLTNELRHREAEAQSILGAIVEGVFAVDEERRIRYLNPQAAQMLGVEVAGVAGRFCGDVLHPVGPDGRRPCEDHCPIVHARSRGRSRAVEHLELAGGRRTVVLTSAPPAGASQVQVMRDETEIEAARRSRDAVLANVSHELKTPLTAQLASIELLRDGLGTLEPAAAAGLVAGLERSTLRLRRLVDNLLESVRIETGQAAGRRVPVDLGVALDEAVAMTEPLLAQRRQRLDVELGALPPVVGDPGQLVQVLVNLLANANKFAPEGSAIRAGGGGVGGSGAGGSGSGGDVSLWIEDAGPGVPPALSASVFDRFRRAGEGEGMGLGLWIAKSIVERHGGSIAVGPSRAGGARFTLILPAATSPVTEAEA